MQNTFSKNDSKSIRIGRLLEILDYIAVQVCFKFCNTNYQERKVTIVTACVDNMQFFSPMNSLNDISIIAYPSFIGKTSIEVQVDVS